MKRFTFAKILCIAALTALLLPVAKADDAEKLEPGAGLQGLWQVVAMEMGGVELPEKKIENMWMLVKGDKISLNGDENNLQPYETDAAAKPNAMDVTMDNGDVVKAIYELDGDILKICYAQSTRLPRPASFDTEDTKYMCLTLKHAPAVGFLDVADRAIASLLHPASE
ncbi:MAG: TIGR03067 domain-containing protein [Akkermansiaceae bacterium]|nr:TIGR03067 domain-containing protein [Akkermansiaceae bacterium]